MSPTPSPGKKCSGRDDTTKTHVNASVDVHESGSQYLPAGIRKTKKKFTCVPVKESDRHEITIRMSPESQRILAGTKWSESGFIPSFQATDKILMKAARRTYNKTHGNHYR